MFIYNLYFTILIYCLSLSLAYTQTNLSEMFSFKVVDYIIKRPLGNKTGSSIRGRDLVAGRKANCLACHQAPIIEESFHGNFGPSLVGVGSRLSKGAIRLRVVNSKLINPDSIMPAYYSLENLTQVIKKYKNKTILDAQEIEDIVEYLYDLKETQ